MKDALQGLVARKVLDMMEFAAAMRGNIEDPFGRSATLSVCSLSRVNARSLEGHPLLGSPTISCVYCVTVSGLEDTTLAQIVEATEEKPALMPLPPASAFTPSANGGLSIVEEILARQVCTEVCNILLQL